MKYQIAAATTKRTRMIHHQSARPPPVPAPAPAPAPAPGVEAVPGAVPGGVVVWANADETARTKKPNSVAKRVWCMCPPWVLEASASLDNAGTTLEVQTADLWDRVLMGCRRPSVVPDPMRPFEHRLRWHRRPMRQGS